MDFLWQMNAYFYKSKIGTSDLKGFWGCPPQNMLSWHKDHSELEVNEKRQAQDELSALPLFAWEQNLSSPCEFPTRKRGTTTSLEARWLQEGSTQTNHTKWPSSSIRSPLSFTFPQFAAPKSLKPFSFVLLLLYKCIMVCSNATEAQVLTIPLSYSSLTFSCSYVCCVHK